MKRLGVMLLLAAGLCSVTLAAPQPAKTPPSKKSSRRVTVQEPETLRELKPDEVAAGMRVKLVLKYGRPMIGTVARAADRELTLDMSYEAEGLPANFRFKRTDVVKAFELARQTDDERQAIQSHRSQVIRRIKVETSEEYAKRRAESRTEEEKEVEKAKALEAVIASKEEERMRALLAEFPPAEWSEARFNEIRDNWWLRDLMPTDAERRFTTVFREWKVARDTIATIDAEKDVTRGTQLLLKFPPAQGWGAERLADIAARATRGEPVTDAETEFRNSYEPWSAALRRRLEEAKTEETKPEETKEPTPEPEKPAETPAEKPAEEPAEPAPAKPEPEPTQPD